MRLLALLLCAWSGWAAVAAHPRVFMTPTRLADLQAKAEANESSWVNLKSGIQVSGYCVSAPWRLSAGTAMPNAPAALMVAAVALSYPDDAARAAANFNTNPAATTYYLKYLECGLNSVFVGYDYYGPKRKKTFTATAGQTDFALDNPIFWYPYRVRVVSGGTTDSLASTGAIGVWGDAQTKDWKYERGSATLHRTGAALLDGDTVEVIYSNSGADCISGTFNTWVANDGTYGYLASGTWTTPTNIPCTLQPRGATTTTAQTLNEVRNLSWIPGLAMDWLYDEFDSTTIDAIVGWSRAAVWYTGALSGYTPYLIKQGQGPAGNLAAGQMTRMGLVGILTHGDNPTDDGDTNYEIDRALGWIRGYAKPYFGGGTYPDLTACGLLTHNCLDDTPKSLNPIEGEGMGGAWPEGPEYAIQSTVYWLQLVDAWETSGAAGLSLLDEMPDLVTDLATWHLHKTSPTTISSEWQSLPYGDMQLGRFGLTSFDRTAALLLSDILGATDSGNYIRQWFNTTQATTNPTKNQRYWDALFWESGWTAASYSGLATRHKADGQRIISIKSDWSTTATWFSYFGGSRWVNHQQCDSGAFAIYRKGQWLSLGEIGYGSNWATFAVRNALVYRPTASSRDYGSTYFDGDTTPTLTRYKEGTGWTYWRNDLAGTYRSSRSDRLYLTITTYEREVVHLSPDVAVIFDRVKPTAETALYFQMATVPVYDGTTPSVASNVATVALGTQKLILTAAHTSPSLSWRSNNDQLPSGTYYINNSLWANRLTGLSAGVDAATLSLPVSTWSNTQTAFWPNVITLGTERIRICSANSSTFTVCSGGRGYDGTVAASHLSGDSIYGVFQRNLVRSAWTAAANTSSYGAHVIEAADSATTPAVVTGIDADTHYGVQVETATPEVAVFAKLRQDYSSVSIVTTYTGNGNVLFSGLSAGTYTVTLDAVEVATGVPVGSDGTLRSEGVAAGTLAVQNNAAPIAPTITTTSVPSGTVGAVYGTTLEATGDPTITWSVVSGSLPGGLSLSSAGVISGTPTAAGDSTFTVRASNAGGTDDQELTIPIAAAPVAESGARVGGTVGGRVGGQ